MISTNISVGDKFSGVLGEEVANRIKTELQYWHLDDMDQCKVGLEIVFKGIESDQQSKRNPRDKSTKISKSVSIFGVKVTETIDKKGGIEGAKKSAVKGAKKGAVKGAVKGGIAGSAGGPVGAAAGAATGAVTGAVKGAVKGAIKGGLKVKVSYSRRRTSYSSRRRTSYTSRRRTSYTSRRRAS